MAAAMTVTAAAVITVPPRSAMKEGAAKIRSGQPLNTSPMIRLPKMANGSGNVTVCANMVYDSQWDAITEYADIPFGIYSFEASENPVPEAIDTSSEMEGIGGAVLDGKYYFITATYNQSGNIEGGVMYVYNASNWTLENRKIFSSDNPGALACNRRRLEHIFRPEVGMLVQPFRHFRLRKRECRFSGRDLL